MKNAIIFHGTDDKAGSYWQAWLKTELEKDGYKVEMPYYPGINHDPIDEFLPKVLASHKFNEETVLIGHSAGGPLILSILQNIDTKIKQAVLVAGYCTKPDDQMPDPILQSSYNWEIIKDHAKDFVFINSVNDPWKCNDKQGRAMFDKLGGTVIIKNEGHFGSGKYNQPYPKFPLLRALILGDENEA